MDSKSSDAGSDNSTMFVYSPNRIQTRRFSDALYRKFIIMKIPYDL